MRIYKFRKYKDYYPKIFQKEKLELEKILPKSAKIEHIGSTSVSGLGGKGVIDIIIGVKKNEIKKTKKILSKDNYLYREQIDNRLFFRKEKGFFIKRRIHLHLTVYNNHHWKKAIKFRERLKKSKRLQKDYSELKKQACRICKGEGKIYRECKNQFIKKVLEK